jgi:mannose-1-phosphate guanylyltransferase/mannose-6-phosphate isomerase
LIQDANAFHEVIAIGLSWVEIGKMVTFGIKPAYPETGYGYLETLTSGTDVLPVSDVKNLLKGQI